MRKILVLLCALFCVSLMPLTAADVECELPILTVCGNTGNFDRIHLEYHDTGKDSPLRVSISENASGCSGDTIRASVWQATVTAAMQRNNLMHGIRITVDFSDFVDGPSAGAVLCLGILSAMDNRPFPMDFAMTGTIMPDGTVGVVGGVALKMRAAAKSGIKRICIPALIRFEKQDDGSMVDLLQEAEKLGMKVCPVEHISEAYAFLHNQPMPKGLYNNEREVCKLPPELEKVLIEQYNYYLIEVVKNFRALSEEEQKEFEKSPFYTYFVPDEVLVYFEAGKLLTATDKLFTAYVLWQAKKEKETYFQQLIEEDHQVIGLLNSDSRAEQIKGLQELHKLCAQKFNAQIKNFDISNVQFFPDNEKITAISAQCEQPLKASNVICLGLLLQSGVDLSEKRIQKLQDVNVVSDEEFETEFKDTLDLIDSYLLFCYYLETFYKNEGDYRLKQVSAIPQIKDNDHILFTCQIFHSSWMATDKSLSVHLNSSNDKQLQGDWAYQIYQLTKNPSILLYRNIEHLGDKLEHPCYHAMASTMASIRMFSEASSLLIQSGPDLGMQKNDAGKVTYRNSSFLNYLIRNARNHALSNIAECQRLKIPCIAPIALLESADIEREKADGGDKMQVLEQYWQAGFQAKALVMSYQ